MTSVYAGWLSMRATLHRPLPTMVSALGLAAVLAPLLILYGLKAGIVFGLIENLRNDPSILRVTLVGNAPLTGEQVASLRGRQEVGFVVGSPRSLAARMELGSAGPMSDSTMVDWLPTDEGDPLLPEGKALGVGQIAITEQLAEALDLEAGSEAVGIAYRNNDNEFLEFEFVVEVVLPRNRISGMRVLAHSEVIDSLAAFHDNYEIPDQGLAGKPLASRIANYDSLRLYASSIDNVVDLVRIMTDLGFRAESHAANIQWVRSLDVAMSGVFAIIASAGLVGFTLSLWANVTSNLQHYRSQLSLLRLLGLTERSLVAFPLVQGVLIATMGIVLSAAIAAAVAFVINGLYLTDMFEGRICRLSWQDMMTAALISYAVAAAVVLQQVRGLRRISMSEALAENV